MGINQIADLLIENQAFAEITYLPDTYNGFKFDGLIGLSYPNLSVDGMAGVFDNMMNQGLITEDLFSIWLNRWGTLYLFSFWMINDSF